MFSLIALLFVADPTFAVENKIQTAFVVTNKTAVVEASAAPTPMSEVVRVLEFLPKPSVGFVDFGCGDARWCIAAAERWPGVHITGVEIDPARAAAARERVRVAGFEDRIRIITGDAIATEVEADVGVAYLYTDVLERLKPRIEKLRAFASYMHKPPGLAVVRNGDSFLYFRDSFLQLRPVVQRPIVARPPVAVWGGRLYQGAVCSNPNCQMCQSIRSQLATPHVATPSKAASGQWVKRCNGRSCWWEWVQNY